MAVAGLPQDEGRLKIAEAYGCQSIVGDALVAQQFQKLLRYSRPDLEEELSSVIGDVAAHGVGEFVRSAVQWVDETRRTMGENVGEYLQEESRALPSRYEVENFRDRVNALSSSVRSRRGTFRTMPGSTEPGSRMPVKMRAS